MNENQNQNQETEHSEPSLAKSRNKMPLIAAAVLLVVAATAAIWAFGGSHKQQVSAQEHLNPTSIAYTAEGKVGIVRNQETFDLYVNGAKGGNREMINQIMSGSIPYAGDKNYVELANGDRVYIRMEVLSITPDERQALCSDGGWRGNGAGRICKRHLLPQRQFRFL